MLSKQNPTLSPSSLEFKRTFTDSFNQFAKEATLLASGNADFNDTWVDTLGKEGLAISVTLSVGIIAILGALAVISTVASAGIAIPVAVLGVVAGIVFYKWRGHVKQKRYEHAVYVLGREDLTVAINDIADVLVNLYHVQLENCTVKDAHILAEGCVKIIEHNILMNKEFSFSDLLSPSSLQALFMNSLSKVPKTQLDMNIVTEKKFNMRGLIGHSAYYCKETDEFYHTTKSKSAKYGVLLFDKKADIEDYESMLKTNIVKMHPHEVHTMMRSSMFQVYREKRVTVVQEDERDGEAVKLD